MINYFSAFEHRFTHHLLSLAILSLLFASTNSLYFSIGIGKKALNPLFLSNPPTPNLEGVTTKCSTLIENVAPNYSKNDIRHHIRMMHRNNALSVYLVWDGMC